MFRRESWHASVLNLFSRAECIANAKISGRVHEANHVPWPSLLHDLPLLPEKLNGTEQAHGFSETSMRHVHSLRKLARANSHENDPIAMIRIHICLDFEDQPRESRIIGLDKLLT